MHSQKQDDHYTNPAFPTNFVLQRNENCWHTFLWIKMQKTCICINMHSSVLQVILDFVVTSEKSSVFHTVLSETTGKQKIIIFLRLLDP
jgi:hypothetical protein